MANGSVAFDDDGICPPWWPFWWRRFKNWPPRPPKELEQFEQFHLTMTIHELASQLKDGDLAKGIQGLTGDSVKRQAASLPR